MALNTISINDRLGDGGLESVAVYSHDSAGNVTGLVDVGGGALPIEVGRCHVQRVATQTVATNTMTAIIFDDTFYDNLSALSVADASKVVVPAGISYAEVRGNAGFPATIASGSIRLTCKINNVAGAHSPSCHVAANADATDLGEHLTITSARFPVTPGDYLQMLVKQTSGSPADFANPLACWFEVRFFRTA